MKAANSERKMRNSTVHKVRQINQPVPFLCISISQHSAIGHVPAKSIGDEDNQALGCAFGTCNVGGQAVDSARSASRGNAGYGTAHTVATGGGGGHFCS